MVTGASSGIGRATAVAPAGQGARVVLVARRADELTAVAAECAQRGGEPMFGSLLDVPLADVRRVLDVNLMGYVHGARAALPHLIAQRRGVLVNVSSILGVIAQPYGGLHDVEVRDPRARVSPCARSFACAGPAASPSPRSCPRRSTPRSTPSRRTTRGVRSVHRLRSTPPTGSPRSSSGSCAVRVARSSQAESSAGCSSRSTRYCRAPNDCSASTSTAPFAGSERRVRLRATSTNPTAAQAASKAVGRDVSGNSVVSAPRSPSPPRSPPERCTDGRDETGDPGHVHRRLLRSPGAVASRSTEDRTQQVCRDGIVRAVSWALVADRHSRDLCAHRRGAHPSRTVDANFCGKSGSNSPLLRIARRMPARNSLLNSM